MQIQIPADVTIKNHGGDLILTSVDIDAARYQDLKEQLPAPIQTRLIGFIKIGAEAR